MRKIILLRHAIAEPGVVVEPDEQRALTAEGTQKMRQAAAGMRNIAPEIDLIAFSPLLRARQTAEILADQYPAAMRLESSALAPGRMQTELASWLQNHAGTCAVLIGHEPDLSHWASQQLCATDGAFIELKKAGACLLQYAPGQRATLIWLLSPKQLRALGG